MKPICLPLINCLFLLGAGIGMAQQPMNAQWPNDEVILANGGVFRGLILEELPNGLKFQVIQRPPGRPTLTFTTFFAKKEIQQVRKLSDADRAMLQSKVAALDPSGSSEHRRMDGIEFSRTPWFGQKDAARMYEGDSFVLVSIAPEEITRRAAIRLDQIYTAFARYFPSQAQAQNPKLTRVELTGDMEEYQKLMKLLNKNVINPAAFDPSANRIICGSDFRTLSEELSKSRFQHLQQLATLERYEKDLRDLYKQNRTELDRHLASLKREREKIFVAERENDKTFDLATRKLFAILYHEAFHSYIMAYIYPPSPASVVRKGEATGTLPHWLNEGLAQIFETPILEAGELRIGHTDPERQKLLKNWLIDKKGSSPPVIPLTDLLNSGLTGFAAAHANQQETSDKSYLTAYAVAYYLMFERRLIGGKELAEYLKAVNGGQSPVVAFEKYVGQNLAEFEVELWNFWKNVQADGTVKKTK